jgi:NAD(P)-dependent dehydrogenase (short-subunit alcohol dehydrogenase family)
LSYKTIGSRLLENHDIDSSLLVLVNNAGVSSILTDRSLPALRRCCNEMCSVNMTSVMVMSFGFFELLEKAPRPRVINVTSGLKSIEGTLTRQMIRYAPYGMTKVGVNGITAHLQAMENDRMLWAELEAETNPTGHINYFSVAPGLLKTDLTRWNEAGADPKVGAEAVVELIADDEGRYKGGSRLELVDGEMRVVPC